MQNEKKQKRIKRVFSNANQVIHLWANQSQSDARSRNVFFEDESIYSYGYHYELGRMIKYNGRDVAVINSRGYSMTTSGHINSAVGACAHLITIKSPDGSFNIFQGLLNEQEKLIDDIMSPFKSRFNSGVPYWVNKGKWGPRTDKQKLVNEFYTHSFIHDAQEFNKKCVALGHDELSIKIDASFFGLYVELMDEADHRYKYKNTPDQIAKKQQKQQKLIQQKLEKDKRQLTHELDQWYSFNIGATSLIRNISPQIFRIDPEKNLLETSRGAQVKLSDAIQLSKSIANKTAQSGDSIGSFTFNGIKDDVVKIGCHTFDICQVNRLLQLSTTTLKLINSVE